MKTRVHHRLPEGRYKSIGFPFRRETKMPRTKPKLCFGTNSSESAVPPKLTRLSKRSSRRVPLYAQRGNGRSPSGTTAYQKPSSCPPKSIHAETVPPFHHRRLSFPALYALLFFVLGFDGSIIAQSIRLVKGFMQYFREHPSFFTGVGGGISRYRFMKLHVHGSPPLQETP